jgi:hypothetical protein
MTTRAVLFACWACVGAFGGQSIQFPAGQSAQNMSVPAQSPATPWYMEFYIHDWSNVVTDNTYVVKPIALGVTGYMYASSGSAQALTIYSQTENQTTAGFCTAQIGSPANLPAQGIYVRYQHVPGSLLDQCEVWDTNGNRILAAQTAYTSPVANSPGVAVGGTSGYGMGFFRICTGATIGLGSRTPTTAGGCPSGTALLEWKFDGNLNDSSINGYTASMSAGFATYVATPNQSVVAVIKTAGAPFWSNWASMRAGFPVQLDGTASFSQSDSSDTVTCFWQMLSSPAPVTWDSRSSCTPTITGVVFGDHNVELAVTDSAGNQAVVTQHIGAVATDSNGVVVQANPATDSIFGPMIAFGRNPWGLADYWALRATSLRYQDYLSYGFSPTWPYAPWEQAQTGTISYTWDGIGMGPVSAPGTTLSGAGIPSAAATSFTVADIAKLDVHELPTRVYISSPAANYRYEEIWICSADANTLTVCYDGRGWTDPDNSTRLAARSWPAGSLIGQFKVTGSGTQFLATLCPGGAHSPVGLVSYNTGTIALTAGSPAIAGNGTTWSSPSVVAGYTLRVSASHGGQSFVFLAPIQTLTDATHITLSRAFPSDADTGTYSYQIVSDNATSSRYPVLHYARSTDGSDAMKWFPNGYGCESDTALYLSPSWDVTGVNGALQNAKYYAYMDQSWWVNQSSTGGLDFYGEDLAHRALYLRSGLGTAQSAANMIGDMWVRMPMISGTLPGAPLFIGGLVIGGIADAMLSNTAHRIQWSDLRAFASWGAANIAADGSGSNCNTGGDNRDTGYGGSWIALAALFDPSPSQWQTPLAKWNSRENVCKGADNSWISGFYFNTYGTPIALTSGSAVGTGTNIPASGLCAGVASGTGAATSGSGIVTGTGLISGTRIAITGTRNGAPFTQWASYTLNSDSRITLNHSAAWQGDTGSIAWMIDSAMSALVFGQTADDATMSENWSCIRNSATQITLNRPWDGPSGTHFSYTSNVAGKASQPYMLGIKQSGFRWGSYAASANGNPALASDFVNLFKAAGTWEQSTGFDPITNGFYYSRGMNMCEPITPASMGNGSCYSDADAFTNYNQAAERVLSAENSASLRSYYDAQNGSNAAVAWGDRTYGSCYGNPAYTTAGVYTATDGNTCDSANGNLNDTAVHIGKWTGFFFGMGMAHQWPAVRMGGVAPAANRTLKIGFNLSNVPNATGVMATVTLPSGAVTTYNCPSSPCSVAADARQGSPVVQWQYTGSGGQILAQSDPITLVAQ